MKLTIVGVFIVVLGAAAYSLCRELIPAEPTIQATCPPQVPLGEPKAVVEETRFEFGTMDVGEEGERWFTVRNAGTGDLELRTGSTSCSCTLSELDRSRIPPGEEGRIRLQWKPPKPAELFAQGATITTNDPALPSVYFNVLGRVRAHLAIEPESIVFSGVPHGESAIRRFLVYSQAWDEFALDVQTNHPQLSVHVEPADAKELESYEALAGYAVTVELAAGLKPGWFNGELALVANSKTAGEESNSTFRKKSLIVTGEIAKNIWLEGPNLLDHNVLSLKTIPLGTGKQRSLALFVRGEDADVNVSDIKVKPAFLRVQIGPREQVTKKLAKYRVDVEVPHDAPATSCVGTNLGEIRWRTDHPEAPEMKMGVEFAIVAEQPPAN